jgi:hypothetical protein
MKNMDPLNENVVSLLQNSSDTFVAAIWKDGNVFILCFFFIKMKNEKFIFCIIHFIGNKFIDWCLMSTLAMLQLCCGMNFFIYIRHLVNAKK